MSNRETPIGGGRADRPANAENVLYVNENLYAALAAEAAKARDRTGQGDRLMKPEVMSLLHWEARLLDGGHYREWLKLLSEDCIYWVPASREKLDPRFESSISFDDRRRLIDRIALIETGVLHAQIPPSRTCRLISNIECWSGGDGHCDVRSNIALWEYRRGQTRCYVGWQEHQLIESGQQMRIRKKVIHLLNCDEPQGNITFIL